jgi:hypothetical protein
MEASDENGLKVQRSHDPRLYRKHGVPDIQDQNVTTPQRSSILRHNQSRQLIHSLQERRDVIGLQRPLDHRANLLDG